MKSKGMGINFLLSSTVISVHLRIFCAEMASGTSALSLTLVKNTFRFMLVFC